MIEAVVDSIRVSLVTQQRVVFLREVSGERHLPIWIGPFEAEAIAMELQGVQSKRPLPYDLLKTVIADLDGKISRIEVSELSDGIFYARIVIDLNGRQVQVDSRPSDALALGVRAKVPILVAESVMDEAGVELNTNGEDEDEETTLESPTAESKPAAPVNEEKLSVFRDFINSLDIDDLGKKKED
ncbi:MAG TPA: bifunctional nuclease family protein [Thermomicrobiales bacterium]|jgi:bifunctional DNase/RNase